MHKICTFLPECIFLLDADAQVAVAPVATDDASVLLLLVALALAARGEFDLLALAKVAGDARRVGIRVANRVGGAKVLTLGACGHAAFGAFVF